MIQGNDYGNVADLYDTYVPVDFDVPFFLSEAKKTSGDVLELMSGTGRVSLPLIEAGVRLTCVDLSPEMLAVLQTKLEAKRLTADLHAQDVRELNLGKSFDLIFIPFHSFSEIVSVDDERAVLARIREHLKPGGRFICTLRNVGITGPADGSLRLFGKYRFRQGTLLLWIAMQLDPVDSRIADVSEFFEEYDAHGMLVSKRMLSLRARSISKSEFESLAGSAGFRATALYGNYDCAPFDETSSPFMIWEMKEIDPRSSAEFPRIPASRNRSFP